jgi:enoyl-[acyl-carrier protein] reductase I
LREAHGKRLEKINMGFLSGRRALIVGLATDRSIAWGIAQAMHAQGAELAFAHIERMTDRVVPLAQQLGSDITFVMDVASDEEIANGFAHLKSRWDGFDILVHAVAFAPREALTGGFLDATTREGFRVAHDISSYSFTALARASLPFMQDRAGSMLSLSYLGAVRSIPGYNVMGLAKASLEANVRFLATDLGPHRIRVNAISAGPIKTLSAAGIPGLRKMLAHVAATAPIRRNVTIEDVGNAAAFLCSDLAAGISGEVLYVDGGFHTVGMSFPSDSDGP